MSRKSYIVKIENPCSESWQEMSSVAGGRFCAHCSKAVIDFSSLSDDEIIKIIERQNENVCGRFQAKQLNKELVQSKQIRSSKGFYKYLAGLLLLGISKNAFSDNNKFLPKENIVANPIIPKNIIRENINDTSYKEIKGRVLDSTTQKPIGYVSIIDERTKKETLSDSEGYFKLNIPVSELNLLDSIVITSVGYHKVSCQLGNMTDSNRNNIFYLRMITTEEDQVVLTGDVVVTNFHKHKKHWWQFWK